jgi:sirohydrochlorin ferrochelatase
MDVARECVGQQISHLTILPLFLSIGAHLTTDVPEQVKQVKAQFPQLEVEVRAPVGEDPRWTRLIQQIVVETLNH